MSCLADEARKQDKAAVAIEYYTKALRIKPNYPDALVNLGVTLIEQGRIPEGASTYTK